MIEKEIETLIEECKEGASDDCFSLDNGHTKVVNERKYANLLEHLIRTYFRKIPNE